MKQSETKSYLVARLLALVALVAASSCGGGSSSRYCDANTPCNTTAYPYCDLSQNLCVATAPPTDGTFVVSWDITINNVQVNACADAGVSAIETVATDQLDPLFTAYSDIFRNCDAFAGTTFTLPLSDYTVTWAALDSNDLALTPVTEPAPFDVILSGNDQLLPLAVFDF